MHWHHSIGSYLKLSSQAVRLSQCVGVRGATLVEFAIVAPFLILLIAGVVDYGLALGRIEVISSAAREGARTAAAYDLLDELAGSPDSPTPSPRGCRGFSRDFNSIYCNLGSPIDLDCSQSPERETLLECAAINSAQSYLKNAGLNPADWKVSSDACIASDPPPATGTDPSDLKYAFNSVRVRIERADGFKGCIWCYLSPLGVDIESSTALFRLEGQTCVPS